VRAAFCPPLFYTPICSQLVAVELWTFQFTKFCFSLFLGAFAKLRKAAVSFVMSVRLSVRSARTRRIFTKFDTFWFSENMSTKCKCRYCLTTLTGILHGHSLCTSVIVYRWIILRVRNVADRFVQKIKTHSLFSITFFSKVVPFVR
jgi:hypothetical protein